ncbi:DUF3006 domain-containing protein [Alkalihalophilus lindianensis]|uniref:DUF3006 domain-containing protein n=1 Tax=Alkalihalophilus lindianensis TaxID=1630542 RepID=A0ABU3XE25_9BACI|nr:DUF3006 domain-containing protein [Alkalihalophilus lindianensis]MDV2686135.1 DUF3006 domain-containing protein [Alkalihalophilus lindianensis]
MPTYTLDRIVDRKIAVLLLKEDESIEIMLSVNELPLNAKEGDLLELAFTENAQIAKINILKKDTEAALKRATSLLEKIKKKNNPTNL